MLDDVEKVFKWVWSYVHDSDQGLNRPRSHVSIAERLAYCERVTSIVERYGVKKQYDLEKLEGRALHSAVVEIVCVDVLKEAAKKE